MGVYLWLTVTFRESFFYGADAPHSIFRLFTLLVPKFPDAVNL